MAPAVTESVTTSCFRCVTDLTGGFQSKVEKAVSIRGLFLKGQEKCQCFTFPRALKKEKKHVHVQVHVKVVARFSVLWIKRMNLEDGDQVDARALTFACALKKLTWGWRTPFDFLSIHTCATRRANRASRIRGTTRQLCDLRGQNKFTTISLRDTIVWKVHIPRHACNKMTLRSKFHRKIKRRVCILCGLIRGFIFLFSLKYFKGLQLRGCFVARCKV